MRSKSSRHAIEPTPSWDSVHIRVIDQGYVKLISINGNPAPDEMSHSKSIHSAIERVLSGERENVVAVNIYRREYLTLDHTGRLRTRSSSTFKGMYKGVAYNTSAPRGKIFSNHNLCIEFNQLLGEYTSACAFARGHVKIWGKAGEVEPPQLVLSLLVEPSKPRLCLDARFSITFG